MKISQYKKWGVAALAAVCAVAFVSCEDQPDKFELTNFVPVVKYIRPADVQKADSLLTGAYMENLICIVGDNLTSISEMYFNDQKAVLNTSFITDHTLLVSVPKEIPTEVTDKIYMKTRCGETVTYDFRVLVPQPSVRAMSNEFAKPGSVATITGDYFIDDPNKPLRITFPGNVEVTDFINISKTAVTFVVPDEAVEGHLTVTSLYGTGRSAFQYFDTRCMLFDWDGSHGGREIGLGWRDGSKVKKNPGDVDWIADSDGSFILFGNDALAGDAGATWAEDPYSFNYWPDAAAGYPGLSDDPKVADMLATYDVAGLTMKFEVLVPASNPWSSCALQIIFSGDDTVTNPTATNAYFSDSSVPRGLWNPWQASGTYDTNGQWTTVSVPLSNFNYTHEGTAAASGINKNTMTGLTFFVWNGGVNGTDCEPYIAIDNIRLAPIE